MLFGLGFYGGYFTDHYRRLLRGAHAAARAFGCDLLLTGGITDESHDYFAAWPALSPWCDFVPVGPWNTDGLIAAGPFFQEALSHAQDLAAAGHPVVFVGDVPGHPSVAVDNGTGIRQAVDHLVTHGHRRIALVAGKREEDGDSRERACAFRAAIEGHGLAHDGDLVAWGGHYYEGGQQAMRQLLATGKPFTAAVASNDASAIGAMSVLHEARMRVPEDVAVVGFDNTVEARAPRSDLAPLTTVHLSSFDLGYRAVGLVLDHVARESDAAEDVLIPTRLVIRRSCGCRFGDAAPSLPGDRVAVEGGLLQALPELVLREGWAGGLEELDELCARITRAFVCGLETGDTEPLEETFAGLAASEAIDDDLHACQQVVLALEEWAPAPSGDEGERAARRALADGLHRVRALVNVRGRLRTDRRTVRRTGVDQQMSYISTRLTTTVDVDEVLSLLSVHLPGLGVRHVLVCLYEDEQGDPVGWSRLAVAAGLGAGVGRFHSRRFPPPGMFLPGKPVHLILRPLTVQGETIGFTVFDAADCALSGRVTWQIASALRSVRLYQEAVEANRLKSRFLSTVSHELRTPLNLIVGLSEMLMEEQQDEGSTRGCTWESLDRIHSSARHLDGLIQDVLDLSRSEVGHLRLVREPLDLKEVLEPVLAAGEHLAREKRLRWRQEIPERLPPVIGDRTRLRQVVLNLVHNAVKFTGKGEVVLRVEAGGIVDCGFQIADGGVRDSGFVIRDSGFGLGASPGPRVTTHESRIPSPQSPVITISVTDTGLGIPPSELEIIFDEFRQSERTARRGYGGAGLGLAICRQLVEMHGGRISAHSSGREGEGSTFTVWLPVFQALSEPELAAALMGEEQTVLVLTESADEGECLRGYLAGRGFEVDVLDVREHDWLWRMMAALPGAVVLGSGPASQSGWEVLRVLKANPATRDVPVLFYAMAREEDSGAVLALHYLAKPMGSAELAGALQRQGIEGESTILVVDDEPRVLEMHAQVVERQLPAARVLRAADGRRALDVIRRERPDLVLLDLMMPEMDGFEVLEAMRGEPATAGVPVIVLTGQLLTEQDMERLSRGVATVLEKGVFTVEETLAHIEAALAREPRLGSETQRVLRRAMAYVHEHHAEPITRADVARAVGVGERHLTRCFRAGLGIAPSVYLNRVRINQARVLLEEGGMSITEVAAAVGFDYSGNFSRAFRREVGVSPSAYRRGER